MQRFFYNLLEENETKSSNLMCRLKCGVSPRQTSVFSEGYCSKPKGTVKSIAGSQKEGNVIAILGNQIKD